jgi:hypothetical protein
MYVVIHNLASFQVNIRLEGWGVRIFCRSIVKAVLTEIATVKEYSNNVQQRTFLIEINLQK